MHKTILAYFIHYWSDHAGVRKIEHKYVEYSFTHFKKINHNVKENLCKNLNEWIFKK